jgi:pimeloyl-ACP methyl ester carboxylesterase
MAGSAGGLPTADPEPNHEARLGRAPVESQRLLGTGLRYHVLEWPATGSAGESAPTAVLLHGFLDSCWTWQVLIDTGRLDGYRVIAPDLRGHGDSDRVGAGGYYHFMDYLADLHELIVQLGSERVSLVGHSMGGTVASYYAGAFPERVQRLITLDSLILPPTQNTLDSIPERVRNWLAAWERIRRKAPRPLADLEDAARRLQLHDGRLQSELALYLAERGTRPLPDGMRQFKHDPLHMTPGPYPFMLDVASSFWRRITCPTLHVLAEASEFQASEALQNEYLRHFRHARLARVPDCGHMLHRHQPTAVAGLICEFLDEKSPG